MSQPIPEAWSWCGYNSSVNEATNWWLGLIALAMVGTLGTLVLMWLRFQPALSELESQLHATLAATRQALLNLDGLTRELRESGLIAQAKATLASAHGAAGRLDPLADSLQATLSGARELLDDATQTSQSVRARVEDLAATQQELTALANALADVAGELRDNELAARLSNVLSDTSLLAADIGILAENANSYLEGSKPLVSNISSVVSSARQRASGISTRLGALREGFKAGVDSWRQGGSD